MINKALRKDPSERYQSVLELRGGIEALGSAPAGGVTKRRSGAAGLGSLPWRYRRRRILIVAAAVVVVAALASVLLPRLWRGAPTGAAYALAVMDFRDLATPDDPTVSAGITELVNIGLIEASPVRVISSEYLHDLSRRLFGKARGPIEEGQAIEIARKAQATFFLAGRIGKSGETQFVTWRLVDAKSGKNVGARRVEGNTPTQLADAIIGEVLPLIAQASGTKASSAITAVENFTTESTRAYQHYIAGLLAKEEMRRDDAIAEFERAVAQDSSFALAYLELGRMHWGTVGYRDIPAAQKYVEKAWTLRSRLGIKDQMRLEAQRHELANRVGDAIAVLREIHKRWPDDRRALVDLEMGLYWRWYFAEALEVDEEGRRLYPDDIVIGGYLYDGALACLGRNEEAPRVTQSFVKRHPSETNGWDDLGLRYLGLGLTDSAEAAFRKAVELDPAWALAAQDFSYCAYQRGDVRGAITVLEKALEQKNLSPNRRKYLICHSDFCLHLAALYVEEGRFQKARDVCHEYVGKLDIDVCALLLAMGSAREVLSIWEQFGKDDYTLSQLYAVPFRGRALAAIGDTAGAEAVAEKLVESEFDWGGRARFQALRIRTEIALARHDPETALKLLRTIERNGSSGALFGGFINIDYRTTLARAYRMASRLDDAADVHKEMLRIYGGHALSHYELGQIYEEMRRPADAKKEYTKFLEMWSEADEGLPQLVDARKRLAALRARS